MDFPMIRTLHLVPALHEGGVERSVINTAILEKSLGLLPIVVSAGGRMVHELAEAGIEHLTWPMASKFPLTVLLNVSRLVQLIRGRDIQIVHAHSRAPAWSGVGACKQTGVPLVTTFHGFYSHTGRLKRLYNSAMTRGQAVITPSAFVRDHVMQVYQVPEDKITVIPLWLNHSVVAGADEVVAFRQQYRLNPDQRVICIVGRLTRWKGHTTLIKAFSHITDSNTKLLLVGSADRASYLQELQQLARGLGLTDRVLFAGGGSEKPALAYAVSDIAVSASTRPETFGLSILEAASNGIPLIASGHGGALDLVLDGCSGLLTAPGNPEALADGLNKILQLDQQDFQAMCNAARQHANTFTAKHAGSALMEVYGRLLHNYTKDQRHKNL
jgi:glycosyltransferase involved in cell wall biosynthesis